MCSKEVDEGWASHYPVSRTFSGLLVIDVTAYGKKVGHVGKL